MENTRVCFPPNTANLAPYRLNGTFFFFFSGLQKSTTHSLLLERAKTMTLPKVGEVFPLILPLAAAADKSQNAEKSQRNTRSRGFFTGTLQIF